jgi:alkylation response protein AidB-like acyl-CoA dehydrogenase
VRFVLDDDQRDFASSLDRLLAGAGTADVARAWADGDHEPALALWKRLAGQGVTSLATDATPVEVCVAFEALGRHAVPGPWVESAAYLPALLGAEVEGIGTVGTPLALDADVADRVYVAEGGGPAGTVRLGTVGERRESVDPTRRLFTVTAGEPVTGDAAAAWDLAVLACSAQLLGLGEHLLETSVDYVKQRKQFGREIGSYQAIKHRLADVRIALDFARPLVFGAALGEVPASAAKVAAGDAAYTASRAALQVHGAIGYTRELDLSLWMLKVRALVTAWGTPAHHRAVLLEGLL